MVAEKVKQMKSQKEKAIADGRLLLDLLHFGGVAVFRFHESRVSRSHPLLPLLSGLLQSCFREIYFGFGNNWCPFTI